MAMFCSLQVLAKGVLFMLFDTESEFVRLTKQKHGGPVAVLRCLSEPVVCPTGIFGCAKARQVQATQYSLRASISCFGERNQLGIRPLIVSRSDCGIGIFQRCIGR